MLSATLGPHLGEKWYINNKIYCVEDFSTTLLYEGRLTEIIFPAVIGILRLH